MTKALLSVFSTPRLVASFAILSCSFLATTAQGDAPATATKIVTETKTVTETKSATESKTKTKTKTVTETITTPSPTLAPTAPAVEKPSAQLSKDLIGAWVLEQAATPGTPSGIGTRLKFFTGTHWMITQPGETGVVVFHHGGTYSIEGDTVTTTTNFAADSTASMIGQSFQHKISVDGDTMKQTGIDNPYTETWKRAR